MKIIAYCYMLTFLVALPCQADNDFITETCANNEFLKCIGINTTNCKNAFERSKIICNKQHPIEFGLEREKFRAKAKENSECRTREFMNGIGADDEKLDKCSKYLQPMFDRFSEKVKKDLERLEKKNSLSD